MDQLPAECSRPGKIKRILTCNRNNIENCDGSFSQIECDEPYKFYIWCHKNENIYAYVAQQISKSRISVGYGLFLIHGENIYYCNSTIDDMFSNWNILRDGTQKATIESLLNIRASYEIHKILRGENEQT